MRDGTRERGRKRGHEEVTSSAWAEKRGRLELRNKRWSLKGAADASSLSERSPRCCPPGRSHLPSKSGQRTHVWASASGCHSRKSKMYQPTRTSYPLTSLLDPIHITGISRLKEKVRVSAAPHRKLKTFLGYYIIYSLCFNTKHKL